jgi:hypothetical protein
VFVSDFRRLLCIPFVSVFASCGSGEVVLSASLLHKLHHYVSSVTDLLRTETTPGHAHPLLPPAQRPLLAMQNFLCSDVCYLVAYVVL